MHIAPKGFTVLFAVLVASLLLAVGLAIFDITFKEVIFASVSRNSDFAIYAADTGLECGLYLDKSYQGSVGSAFATSSATLNNPTTGLICNGQDITDPTKGWSVTKTPTNAITTFQVTLTPLPYCAKVVVTKTGSQATTILSSGYNTDCASTNPARIERALEADF